ncbi:MAG TPA: four helix bundle protein [Gemmatimonadaceae bacterium]
MFEHASRLALGVYRLTDAFPDRERFVLSAQMQRAAISVGSNIAEGCGRRGDRELLQFLYIASGSARELGFQLHIAALRNYGDASQRAELQRELDSVQRTLNRLTARLRARTP